MNCPHGLAKNRFNGGIGQVNARQLHGVKRDVGSFASQQHLARVSELSFVPFQWDVEERHANRCRRHYGQN